MRITANQIRAGQCPLGEREARRQTAYRSPLYGLTPSERVAYFQRLRDLENGKCPAPQEAKHGD